MGMSDKPDAETDWAVECSDEEKYDPVGKRKDVWEPAAQDIKDLYEKLASGEVLTLEWQCRGRRSPTPEPQEQAMDAEAELEEKTEPEEKSVVNEFDFDDEFGAEPPKPVTPCRTPGSARTPRTQTKRVARLDKIMADIRRHKQINEEADKTPTGGTKIRTSPSSSGTTTPQRPTQKGNMSPKKLS